MLYTWNLYNMVYNYNSIKKEVEPECIKNILKFNYCILHPSSGAGNRLYDCTEYRKWTDEHYPETPHGGLEVALSLWDASPFRWPVYTRHV